MNALGGKLEAVIWIQGEADVSSGASQAQYDADLATLFAAILRICDPALTVLVGFAAHRAYLGSFDLPEHYLLFMAAGVLLTVITLMTCVSLIGRNTTGWTIVGDFELSGAAAGAAVALFLPWCQVRRGTSYAVCAGACSVRRHGRRGRRDRGCGRGGLLLGAW